MKNYYIYILLFIGFRYAAQQSEPCCYGQLPTLQNFSVCINSESILPSVGCKGIIGTYNFTGSASTSAPIYSVAGTYQYSVTFAGDNCITTIQTATVIVVNCSSSCETASITIPEGSFCFNNSIFMSADGCNNPSAVYNWSFGDGLTGTGNSINHSYQQPGTYNIQLTVIQFGQPDIVINKPIVISDCIEEDCKDCIGSFQPSAGNYILSAWVKEDLASGAQLPKTYSGAKIEINFLGVSAGTPPIIISTDGSKNKIIDGWQRIEQEFTIPSTATNLLLKLNNTGTQSAYYDDIRIFPTDGQMKTYVYDPITLRLTATLDENNYATFYEYDEEGKLIRVKKETEKGIMTIQESREGTKKK
jgi:hypothetical protein